MSWNTQRTKAEKQICPQAKIEPKLMWRHDGNYAYIKLMSLIQRLIVLGD